MPVSNGLFTDSSYRVLFPFSGYSSCWYPMVTAAYTFHVGTLMLIVFVYTFQLQLGVYEPHYLGVTHSRVLLSRGLLLIHWMTRHRVVKAMWQGNYHLIWLPVSLYLLILISLFLFLIRLFYFVYAFICHSAVGVLLSLLKENHSLILPCCQRNDLHANVIKCLKFRKQNCQI